MRKQSAKQSAPARELDAYRNKRDPATTPEPFSAERKGSGATLQGEFVVHLHDATRRHYDLRLQVGGVLKSFAIPKGPTLDPSDKRLAVNTEDHPLEYLEFEDVIPAGSYGAGPMIAWDLGRVMYLEGTAEEGIERGKIDFQLAGHKLRGRFALVHTGARSDAGAPEAHQWLLIKKADVHARPGDITSEQPHSVLSGLTVEELAAAGDIARRLEDEAARLGAERGEVHAAELVPMLCASDGAPLCASGWLYELKLDGVRIVAERHGDRVELRYRGGRPATAAYPEIARAVRALAAEHLVLDGEIVAFDDRGRPDFQLLARRIHLSRPGDVRRAIHEVPVSYVVFDLLSLGRYDLRSLPLIHRKQLLGELVRGRGLVRVLDHLPDDGRPLMAFCEQNDLEGLVAKRADSRYRPGPKRSGDWVKIKRERDCDLVVVGWEESDKARKLRSLIVAAHDDGELVLRGKVGSGLDDATIDHLLAELGSIEIARCPARGSVTKNGKRHWVEPRMVVSVRYAGVSDSGVLRFPVFRGIRPDVAPEQCVLVPHQELEDRIIEQPATATESRPPGMIRAADAAVRAVLSNQDKVFWPDEGYTKGDLSDYYASVGSALVPILTKRPIVLVRYPDGIAGKSFFQWHVPRGTPDWVRSIKVREEGERGKKEKRTFVVEDLDGLLHIANLGCIPIHILAAREGSLECCDFLTIDLDVGEQPFRHAVTLALTLRGLLDELGLEGFPKTSGQSGLHVLVPLGPGVGFDSAKALVELLGRLLVARHPDIATMERVKEQRGPRVYVDTGQTGRSRTIVAPYSVRAVPGATVSAPLFWDEVHLALDPRRFTMFSVVERLHTVGDPMAQLLAVRPDVPRAVARLGQLLGTS